MRLGAGPSSAILESLHTVRRVATISGERIAAAVLGREAQRIQPNAEVDFSGSSHFPME
jgi:hypothetical protein